jgi:NAD-specific glutamate dehydrogenase
MLADEIAMTVATTRVIADGGAALVPIMIETTGAGVQEIVTAVLKAQQLARMQVVRSTLEELRTTVSLTTLSESFVRISEGARMAALFWLSARGRVPTDDEIDSMLIAIDRYQELQASQALKTSRERVDELLRDDIPEVVAELIVKSRFLNLALMAHAVSEGDPEALETSIIKLQAIGGGSGLLPLIGDLAVRPATGTWEPIALRILFVRFLQLLRDVIDQVAVSDPIESVDQLQPVLESGALKAVRQQVDDLLADEERPSPATLLVLEERVAATMARMS